MVVVVVCVCVCVCVCVSVCVCLCTYMALSHIAYLCGGAARDKKKPIPYQKRPIKRDLSKETYQKRPIPVSKETYSLSRPMIVIAYLCFGGQRSTARNEQTHLQIRPG
jgi:hypothetical protein